MATRTILFRGQTRRKGERTSISGIPLPGIWVTGGVFPQNKGYDYAIIYQQNPKVEKYVVHTDTIGQYTGINDSLGTFVFEDVTILPNAALMSISLSPRRKLQSSSVLSMVSTKIGLSLSTMSKSMRRIGTE